ncbi:hypothetical protein JTE90_022952, partial [Oedothorax gibbosus]
SQAYSEVSTASSLIHFRCLPTPAHLSPPHRALIPQSSAAPLAAGPVADAREPRRICPIRTKP